MKKSISAGLIVIGCLFAFSSCGKKADEKKHAKVIGVTLLTRGHMFYKDLEEGLRSEAAKDDYELIVTAAEFDLGKQIAQIEDFVARKVDAIIVCPVDSKGVGSGIKRANDAKIPVFTADITAMEGNVVSHVASDNELGGRRAGEYIANLLHGKGKVAIIDQPILTSVLDRVAGFKNALAKYPDIKLVSDVNGDGVRDRSLEAASDILQAHPDLNGIFGINDESALGALDAVMAFKRMNIVIVGYDATPPAVDAILKDTPLKADIIQYPKKIGAATISAINDYFSGAPVQKRYAVEVGIVDREALQRTTSP
ncbi:MAG TPA: substrate-binding domain-containing protein [Bacteroidota bacterium]|nr:substrate-binding domain-containing protein [Bacteroidota bacterium]